MVNVFVERHEYDDFPFETDPLIEPTEHFKEAYPLQMATSLVNINTACTSKVSLLNPLPTLISIKQDAVVGVEPVDGPPKVLVGEENKDEINNYSRARRISFSVKDHILEAGSILKVAKRGLQNEAVSVQNHFLTSFKE